MCGYMHACVLACACAGLRRVHVQEEARWRQETFTRVRNSHAALVIQRAWKAYKARLAAAKKKAKKAEKKGKKK